VLRCARRRAGKVASWGPGDETSGKSRQIRQTEVEEPANPVYMSGIYRDLRMSLSCRDADMLLAVSRDGIEREQR